MKIIYFRHYVTCLAIGFMLSACNTTSNLRTDTKGGWINLGVSASGNVQYALDSSSIRHQNDLVTFRDRKTIINPKQQYYNNTPAYKTAISTTQIDCKRKQFRILDVELFDAKNELIRQDHFSDSELRPMGITNGSAAQQQYKYVCSH